MRFRRGRIGFYGVSSNTFVVPGRDPEATSLERMWTIAREVALEHHFAVAQLPANLFESGAMLTRNCVTGNRTALEFAQEHDLAVLVNRPLNAFYREQLICLADTPVQSPEVHDAHVNPSFPPAFRAESLSRKALAVLTNTKGVTYVLSGGAGQPNYVDDSLGALRSPPFDVDLHLYEAFGHMLTGSQRWSCKEILLLISRWRRIEARRSRCRSFAAADRSCSASLQRTTRQVARSSARSSATPAPKFEGKTLVFGENFPLLCDVGSLTAIRRVRIRPRSGAGGIRRATVIVGGMHQESV